MRDPINKEFHRSRHDHARKFNSDLAGMGKDLREQSGKLKVVRLPPNRIGSRPQNGAVWDGQLVAHLT